MVADGGATTNDAPRSKGGSRGGKRSRVVLGGGLEDPETNDSGYDGVVGEGSAAGAEASANDETIATEDGRKGKVLTAAFSSCSTDPRGSVHRTWGVSLILIAVFFVTAIIEVVGISNRGGPVVLAIASGLSALTQITVAVVGTFVLKRFPTRFSVGFFLGLVVVLSQQCLITFAAFGNYRIAQGAAGKSGRIFANLSLSLFVLQGIFALMLVHFREHVLMTPVDAEKFARRGKAGSVHLGNMGSSDDGASSYENYVEE